ncbi:MAG: site-specific DNA-methyltransferase [Chloroflexota bacterium]|nr:MAG: site-specific DNA-methyltransferase [Chloroflexota bacterium]
MNTLFFGDNLDILRKHIATDSVDLIYLDPPFNSKRDYNLLFKTPKGHASAAQIIAFEDSWHWGEQAEREFQEILHLTSAHTVSADSVVRARHQTNTDAAEMIQSLRRFLRENDMMAYLVMMCNRLLKLHRVLKPTGSLYLHCDPTASHYLKIVMDSIFEPQYFRNEIVWKRSYGHGDSKKSMGRSHDLILVYSKTDNYVLNRFYHAHDPEYLEEFFRHKDERGVYKLENLTSPHPRPNLTYEYKGYPPPAKGWRVNRKRMEELDAEGRLHFPNKKDGRIMKKVYLDELEGQPMTDVWTDISPLSAHDQERMGYPTQKPLALLERIISASSNAGDVVLDPFCGCGTAVHAAQKLGRQWIGIDITPLAIHLIEKRMKDAFPELKFNVEGIPQDLDGARDLAARDKYHFQWWACALVGAQPYQGKKKGADSGIDGIIYFQDDKGPAKKIIVSVKGGENVNRAMIADLKNSVEREKAQMGFFVTLAPPTKPMQTEAVSAGYYESPHSGAFEKIQIVTIADLLNGKTPRYPDLSRGSTSFKKSRVEEMRGEQQELM